MDTKICLRSLNTQKHTKSNKQTNKIRKSDSLPSSAESSSPHHYRLHLDHLHHHHQSSISVSVFYGIDFHWSSSTFISLTSLVFTIGLNYFFYLLQPTSLVLFPVPPCPSSPSNPDLSTNFPRRRSTR